MTPPLRAAILPPAPAAYREPLFRALAERDDLDLLVVYQAAAQASWDAAPGFFATEHPYPARHLHSRQRARPGRSPIVWPVGLERALTEFDPDVVVAVEYGAASLRALRWARARGRGYVIFSDCTPEIDPLLSAPQRRLHRALARHADRVIAVSSAGRARLLGFRVAPQAIALAPQSGDLAPVRAAVAAARAGGGGGAGGGAEAGGGPGRPPLRVVSAGRLVADKNFAGLIEAVARADPAGNRIALGIAGTGPLETELRALAAARGVSLTLHGALAPAAMGGFYAAADAFALVSTFEPFGVVVREAVAAGLPIVCSRRAGAAGDIAVAGENALLVDPTDEVGIAAALRRLLEEPERRAAMATASRAIDAAGEGADVAAFAQAIRDAARIRGRA